MLSDALSHELSTYRDLLNHFSKPIVLITCKSFESSGSWEEIDDIKLSNHKHPLWSFSLHTPVKHATVNKRPLRSPHISFCEFLSSVWVTDSVFLLLLLRWPVLLVLHVYKICLLTPRSCCPHSPPSPSRNPLPPAHLALQLVPSTVQKLPSSPGLSRMANLDSGRPPSC